MAESTIQILSIQILSIQSLSIQILSIKILFIQRKRKKERVQVNQPINTGCQLKATDKYRSSTKSTNKYRFLNKSNR